MIITKRWAAFRAVETALLMVYILLCVVLRGIIIAAVGGGAVITLSVIWSWYYYTLEYRASENRILITSGIIIRRERSIPAENILWVMRLRLFSERNTAAEILHTAGGITVIFGELSTFRG